MIEQHSIALEILFDAVLSCLFLTFIVTDSPNTDTERDKVESDKLFFENRLKKRCVVTKKQ